MAVEQWSCRVGRFQKLRNKIVGRLRLPFKNKNFKGPTEGATEQITELQPSPLLQLKKQNGREHDRHRLDVTEPTKGGSSQAQRHHSAPHDPKDKRSDEMDSEAVAGAPAFKHGQTTSTLIGGANEYTNANQADGIAFQNDRNNVAALSEVAALSSEVDIHELNQPFYEIKSNQRSLSSVASPDDSYLLEGVEKNPNSEKPRHPTDLRQEQENSRHSSLPTNRSKGPVPCGLSNRRHSTGGRSFNAGHRLSQEGAAVVVNNHINRATNGEDGIQSHQHIISYTTHKTRNDYCTSSQDSPWINCLPGKLQTATNLHGFSHVASQAPHADPTFDKRDDPSGEMVSAWQYTQEENTQLRKNQRLLNERIKNLVAQKLQYGKAIESANQRFAYFQTYVASLQQQNRNLAEDLRARDSLFAQEGQKLRARLDEQTIYVEATLVDYAQRYLERPVSDQSCWYVAPDHMKNLEDVIEYLQTELNKEREANNVLRDDIMDRNRKLENKNVEFSCVKELLAMYTDRGSTSEAEIIGYLKSELVKAKTAGEACEIETRTQRGHYQALINAQNRSMEQIGEKLDFTEIEVAHLQRKLQEKAQNDIEAPNLRKQLAYRAFGDDKNMLFEEQEKRFRNLHDVLQMQCRKITEMGEWIAMLEQNSFYKDHAIETLKAERRAAAVERTKYAVIVGAWEEVMGDHIRASGSKIRLDFSSLIQDATQGEADELRNVDYSLYEPDIDTGIRQIGPEYASKTIWEIQRAPRAQKEQELHKEMVDLANSGDVPARAFEIFKFPTEEQQARYAPERKEGQGSHDKEEDKAHQDTPPAKSYLPSVPGATIEPSAHSHLTTRAAIAALKLPPSPVASTRISATETTQRKIFTPLLLDRRATQDPAIHNRLTTPPEAPSHSEHSGSWSTVSSTLSEANSEHDREE